MTYYCIICNGEPSTWSVCSIPDINSREAAEILKQQIISNQEIVEKLKATIDELTLRQKSLPSKYDQYVIAYIKEILGDKK